jgi:hypothetical protein
MIRRTFRSASVALFASLVHLALAANLAQAAEIPVPNGDFEDYTAVGAWSSLGAAGLPDQLADNGDEFWSNPATFGSGWTQLTGRRSDGRWGLQHPNGTNHHARNVANVLHGQPNALDGPTFSGHFIGFANMDGDDVGSDATGDQHIFEIQSQILGQLQEGVYQASLDIGFRFGASGGANPWNDQLYEIALVAGGVAADGSNGSTGGTVLGTPGSMTLTPSFGAQGLGANQTTVNYQFVVPGGHANLGDDFALRLSFENLGTRGGAASPNGINDFTQANFDNARVSLVPEPTSLALIALSLIAGLVYHRHWSA